MYFRKLPSLKSINSFLTLSLLALSSLHASQKGFIEAIKEMNAQQNKRMEKMEQKMSGYMSNISNHVSQMGARLDRLEQSNKDIKKNIDEVIEINRNLRSDNAN